MSRSNTDRIVEAALHTHCRTHKATATATRVKQARALTARIPLTGSLALPRNRKLGAQSEPGSLVDVASAAVHIGYIVASSAANPSQNRGPLLALAVPLRSAGLAALTCRCAALSKHCAPFFSDLLVKGSALSIASAAQSHSMAALRRAAQSVLRQALSSAECLRLDACAPACVLLSAACSAASKCPRRTHA